MSVTCVAVLSAAVVVTCGVFSGSHSSFLLHGEFSFCASLLNLTGLKRLLPPFFCGYGVLIDPSGLFPSFPGRCHPTMGMCARGSYLTHDRCRDVHGYSQCRTFAVRSHISYGIQNRVCVPTHTHTCAPYLAFKRLVSSGTLPGYLNFTLYSHVMYLCRIGIQTPNARVLFNSDTCTHEYGIR